MRFHSQCLLFASWILSLTNPTSAHGDHSWPVHATDRSLLPRQHQYPHNIRGAYSHSRSSNILRARELQPQGLEKREISPQKRLKLAEAYIKKETVQGTEWEIDSWYTDEDTGVTHVFAVQTVGGIRVDNARFNVNVLKDGTVFSSGTSFTEHIKVKRSRTKRHKLNPVDALKGAVEILHLTDVKNFAKAKAGRTDSKKKYKLTGGKSHKKNPGFKKPDYIIDGAQGLLSKPEVTLAYMQKGDGTLELTWRIEYDSGNNWMIIYTDAYKKNKLHSVADYAADATYLVYNFDINDPTEGVRTQEVDPFKKDVSPLGWQKDNEEEFTVLRGNNIIAVVNPGPEAGDKVWTELYSPDGGDEMKYIYDFPMDSQNFSDWQDAAATQLFYSCNMIHDLYEKLGFTSQAGNFEEELIGETGGEGGDAVDVHAQYGAPINSSNAFFFTPPDGERPRMMMFLWENPNGKGPWRDSCFSRDVVIHEYTHGLSTRLTGGPENSECLSSTWESRGMGEGWSDWYAVAIGMTNKDTRKKDFKIVPWLYIPDGEYDNPRYTGLRQWSYSTDMEINPLLYSHLDHESIWGLQHQIGTIWCTVLVEFLWNMVEKHGIESDKFPVFETHKSTNCQLPTTGRHLAMKIVLEAMKLQPCNPSFIDARNAIVDADELLTGGENYCEIWTAFAKRGMGVEAYDATTDINYPKHVNDFSVPEDCKDVGYERK